MVMAQTDIPMVSEASMSLDNSRTFVESLARHQLSAPTSDPKQWRQWCTRNGFQQLWSHYYLCTSSTLSQELRARAAMHAMWHFAEDMNRSITVRSLVTASVAKFYGSSNRSLDAARRASGSGICSRTLQRHNTKMVTRTGSRLNTIIHSCVQQKQFVIIAADDFAVINTAKRGK